MSGRIGSETKVSLETCGSGGEGAEERLGNEHVTVVLSTS
jgi:hypothetical protein